MRALIVALTAQVNRARSWVTHETSGFQLLPKSYGHYPGAHEPLFLQALVAQSVQSIMGGHGNSTVYHFDLITASASIGSGSDWTECLRNAGLSK